MADIVCRTLSVCNYTKEQEHTDYKMGFMLQTDALQVITKNSMVPSSKPSRLAGPRGSGGGGDPRMRNTHPKGISQEEEDPVLDSEALFINSSSMIDQETGVRHTGAALAMSCSHAPSEKLQVAAQLALLGHMSAQAAELTAHTAKDSIIEELQSDWFIPNLA
ncbi:hypothetical protein NDU88_002599 [Pleurodeles waltl]|uniref:Uncharacterized protein n=1 Tax=Pleurodeles waltl TaxID=8319 RepID=A0AAV7M228_PLEWA|nr:hypothetical protein NDU88_002599 [Pleurodeles waltl]